MRYKKVLYPLLTLLILGGILLQNPSVEKFCQKEEIAVKFEGNILELFNNPLLIFTIFLYIFLFFLGLTNIFIFVVKKLKKEPLLPQKPFAMEVKDEENWRTLILVLLNILILNLVVIFFLHPYLKKGLFLFIIYNFILEVIILTSLLTSLPKYRLGIKKQEFYPKELIMIYSATLVALIPVVILSYHIGNKLNLESKFHPIVTVIFLIKNKTLLSLLIFQILFLGPVVEELFFRGFLFSWLRKRFSFGLSTLVVSFIFAVLHKRVDNFLPIIILSVVLCFIYERTQNILNSIFIHSLHNFLGVLLILSLKPYSFI